MENHPTIHCPLLRTIVDNGTAVCPKKDKNRYLLVPFSTFYDLVFPVISQKTPNHLSSVVVNESLNS
jgi:hypothetical protein